MPPKRRQKLSGQEKAQLMARVALQKKALEYGPRLLDVAGLVHQFNLLAL